MEHKDYQSELLQRLSENIYSNIKCAYLAKIYKLTLPTAKLQPLAMFGKKKLPMVEDAWFITIPHITKYHDRDYGGDEIRETDYHKLNYRVGDTVLVDVLDLDTEFFKNHGSFQVGSSRRHAMDFSVIVGKIASKNDFYK